MTVALAAPHPAAVEAARTVVAAGGGPIDAAVAAAAALAVAYPHQCSAGGDLVALVRSPDGSTRAVLSIGAAAAGIDLAGHQRMPFSGPLTITVPGAVAGWARIVSLGARLPLADLLAPAIALATDGVAVSAGLRRATDERRDAVRTDPGLSELLLDAAGEPRDVLYQPALAATLRTIAGDWTSFYRGRLAERLVAGLARLDSPLGAVDLAAHEPEVVEPLSTTIGAATWYAAPPPTQGATLLAVLGSPDLLTDATRARAARDALLGDPRGGPIDVDALRLRAPVATSAGAAGEKPRGDTVAVTAVGADGTAVTLIQSVFQSFGSGLLEPATGVVLHNRGASFTLQSGHPGRVRPGVRPPHTLCPSLAVAPGTVVALGCQGGRSQAWILAQVAADVLDADDLAALVARPRWVIGSRELDRDADTLLLEPGTPGAERLARAASDLGLTAETAPRRHDNAGHVQVARLRDGVLDAAGDPRADGHGTTLP
ncbi:gamma-glutamyltransferase [Cryptosporangium arvum]|uniref:gamma-glutamyltransferase n=1 Tax=Cryptosporangium arvum TaxID=80871 RepID=UPI0004B5319A|nr:gamma-glutamyltransferase [Cryptosporangium arvum]